MEFCCVFDKSSAQSWQLPTFPTRSIIGSTGLNFSVRNGKRCDPCDKPPRQCARIMFIVCFIEEAKKEVLLPCAGPKGFEPSRLFAASNFKSDVSTNFTMAPKRTILNFFYEAHNASFSYL